MKKLLVLFFFIILLTSCTRKQEHSYQGYVEGENLYLASPYSGILMELFVQRGDEVKKGQMLFQLDVNPQILAVQQDEASLQQAQRVLLDLEKPRRTPEIEAIEAQIEQTDARLKLAEIRVHRYQELYKKGAVDKDTLDAAVSNYQEQQKLKSQYESNLQLAKLGSREEQIKAQQAQVLSLLAKLKQTKWELEQKQLHAPRDGYIFDTYYRTGEFVGAQQSILSLLPYENIRVEFFVPVDILPQLHRGQKIEFNCYGCQTNGTAIINYISPEAEFVPPLVYSRENSDKLVFRIKARIEQPKAFKPGQPVSVMLP
ncbi:HlyD family secretion protein [Legionella jordanis]|uniref:Hemolysin D n=1 Tax=Legionella jordanis TaxID=456 RepID=A0A0W0VBC3_9GAMM|nr:HlyD family efflux transporter periplasmic adaptor subunit [Legionella jordanis]KTD17428.1 hemolysin D [Legionella jordanis]RMX01808.1 HlyD family efflux transporter periplasmic adaptor subunit [Legionella jordanis]RMX15472.1 HlyD family efflux transporter periplasmic adaptor subunit [Legionella jordanis]VEH11550.1 hemolysin D [Legionella jordanis]HAT8714625.1 HlyD family efflux transporter periplasmic adaptor subunit [Legionella jordanis]